MAVKCEGKKSLTIVNCFKLIKFDLLISLKYFPGKCDFFPDNI